MNIFRTILALGLVVSMAPLFSACSSGAADEEMVREDFAVIEPAVPLQLTPGNYQKIASRSYRLVVNNSLSSFWADAPERDSQVCASGTQSYTLLDRDANSRTSANDEVEKRYVNCRYTRNGQSIVLNGTAKYRVAAVTGSGAISQWQQKTDGREFTLADTGSNSDCVAANRCTFDWGSEGIVSRSDTGMVNVTFSRDGWLSRSAFLGSSHLNLRLNADSAYTHQPISGGSSFRYLLDGFLSGNTIYGSNENRGGASSGLFLSIKTTLPLEGSTNNNGGFASSGSLLMTGDRSAARLTPQGNAGTVRVELDADGDGNFETGQTLSWSSLMAL